MPSDDCPLLRNVTISPGSSLTQEIFEQTFPLLHNIGCSMDMLIGRFDKFPLHMLCHLNNPPIKPWMSLHIKCSMKNLAGLLQYMDGIRIVWE